MSSPVDWICPFCLASGCGEEELRAHGANSCPGGLHSDFDTSVESFRDIVLLLGDRANELVDSKREFLRTHDAQNTDLRTRAAESTLETLAIRHEFDCHLNECRDSWKQLDDSQFENSVLKDENRLLHEEIEDLKTIAYPAVEDTSDPSKIAALRARNLASINLRLRIAFHRLRVRALNDHRLLRDTQAMHRALGDDSKKARCDLQHAEIEITRLKMELEALRRGATHDSSTSVLDASNGNAAANCSLNKHVGDSDGSTADTPVLPPTAEEGAAMNGQSPNKRRRGGVLGGSRWLQ